MDDVMYNICVGLANTEHDAVSKAAILLACNGYIDYENLADP
jgi:hypothetical protein